jgi:hypothetical protein
MSNFVHSKKLSLMKINLFKKYVKHRENKNDCMKDVAAGLTLI